MASVAAGGTGGGEGDLEAAMLKQIRDYLDRNGPCDTAALSLFLKTEESALLGMLAFLEQRGEVKRIEVDCWGGCASCSGCKASAAGRKHGGVIFWSRGRVN